jgi:outer membrane protein assembly factor BamA
MLLGYLMAASHVAAASPLGWTFGAGEVVAGIQIHGNVLTGDDEVKRLAGVDAGIPFEPRMITDIAERLRATKRFRSVDVLKRFASIADPSQILLVIVVDEGAVHIDMGDDPAHLPRVIRNRWPQLMFLPVLTADDGYGVTYGARVALANPVGKRSQLAFPFTWGGEKRAAAELTKTLADAPIDRVMAGVSISRRTNPFFREDDDRVRVWARGERQLIRPLRAGATFGWQDVSFAGRPDRFVQSGADLTFDTRLDPVLPRNAVYIKAGWEHLLFTHAAGGDGPTAAGGINRTDLDARGYLGLVGQNILSVRAQRLDADRPLPPYLQPLLGGMATVRGFRSGTAAGDTLVATSAELIVPLTSPLNIGKIGVSAFVDYGAAYPKGARLADQTMKRGAGGSVWFSAAFFRMNVAVAHGRGASTRVHVGANVSF